MKRPKAKNQIKKLSTRHNDDDYNDSYSNDAIYDTSKKWFDNLVNDPKNIPPVTEQVLIELKDEAKKCHDLEVATNNIKNKTKTSSSYQWLRTAMTKGTVTDKIAAHVISLQDNPVCSLDTIRSLVGMVKAGKRKECTSVIDTLTELFLSDLLRPNHKLRAFHQRPLGLLNDLSSGNTLTRKKLLILWYFEDQLKEIYTLYVLALNSAAQDTVENTKEKAISAMAKLLSDNPEQEKNLLSYIVNKLGDPSQKIASKVIYSLSQLILKHANMHTVVLNDVEKLLFRPNISMKAQYYSLCFLSQFYLSHDASDVAKRLITVYFSFFKYCIKKGEIDSRMMSVLLTGVNRAYPYAKLELDKISEHIDTMYRVVHMANFNIGLHALSLLYQVCTHVNSISDRFYSALYRKLLDPKLLTTKHQAMVLNLIYKSILNDPDLSRVKTFVKRLFQLSLFTQPSFTCGILYVISQLLGKKNDIQAVILKQSALNSIDDDGDSEEKYYDIKDESIEKEMTTAMNKEQDLENFENDADVTITNAEASAPTTTIASSWYHCNVNKTNNSNITGQYNPMNRNPLYAGGEYTAYTELIYLKNHFHPTISLYATSILDGKLIKYSGDPVKDFTLIRFLDRFVFKNPKKGENATANLGAHPTFGQRKMYKPTGLKSLAITSNNYLKEKLQNVPVDELFMYTYLQRKQHQQPDTRNSGNDNDDLESVQSEEFEDMLIKMAGVENLDDTELDFLTDYDTTKTTKNATKQQNKDSSEEQSDEEESGDELSDDNDENEQDEFDDFGSDDDAPLDMEEGDADLIDGLDDDEDEDILFDETESSDDISGQIKGKKVLKKQKKKGKNNSGLIFASADEFAALLDEEGNSKYIPGGSNVLENKDNADVKQLAWEDKRNIWLQGFNNALGKGKGRKSLAKPKKIGNQKRASSTNNGVKSKKRKRKA